jgi:3-hydroxyisobutyrate dehydrogenase-like beta-hydroxyacid dehydrogenase
VSPACSAEVAALLEPSGIAYVRATVSGNNTMAEAAQLTVLASSPRLAYEHVLPLLRLLGPSQFWLGTGEQARLMKLVVNLMVLQTSAMLAEALTLGTKGGLQWRDMWDVLTHSAVASPILKAKSTQLAQRDFRATFTVRQMIKDVNLILDAGERLQVALPQTDLAMQLLHDAAAHGDAEADYAAIIRCVERAAAIDAA